MPNSINPDAIYRLIDVSEPSFSPTGDQLIFVKTTLDPHELEMHSNIIMMYLNEGKTVTFTYGGKDRSPRFSPCGTSIAFIRPDKDGRKQLWLIPAGGGEPRQLTHMIGGINYPSWSPDSKHIVFISDVAPCNREEHFDGKPNPEHLVGLDTKQHNNMKTRVVSRVRYRFDGAGWRGNAFLHMFVINVASGETRQLTDGEGDDSAPTWSPDGLHIAYISDQGNNRDFTQFNNVQVMSADGGSTRIWSEQLYTTDALAWSPDGSRLAVIGTDNPSMWDPRQRWIFQVEMDKPARRLTDGSFTPVPELHWQDNRHVGFIADSRGQSFLCKVSTDRKFQTVMGGGLQLSDLALNNASSKAVVVLASPQSIGELELVDTCQGSRIPLTRYNTQYLKNHPPAVTEKFSISRGSFEIESRLLMPSNLDQARKYPLVLDIHGGPQGRFSDSIDMTHQILATSGYIVLAVNPRGSSSYGPEFASAVFKDWGGQDYLDIMASLDEACKRPYVDRNRLGVHGYSYGGFMSSWIIGHDTRFKAAVVGAPCINLVSMYGTSDIGVSFGDIQWGGSPINSLNTLVKRSPLTYAGNVETPVLLMHGEDDLRCPIGQSEEYFVALKRQGKEVKFVRFPDSGHLFRRSGHPKLRVEYLRRMAEWFDQHLGHPIQHINPEDTSVNRV